MLDRLATALPKFEILGQPVNLTDDYVRWLVDRLQRGIGSHVVTMNAEIVIYANQNPEFSQIVKNADLVTPDGAGLILALRLHEISQRKYAGIELGEDLLQFASDPAHNCSVFFYGGKPQVVEKEEKMKMKQFFFIIIKKKAKRERNYEVLNTTTIITKVNK